MTRSEQTGCEVRTWYLFLSHLWAHWVTVLSPDMCVMDSEGLWLAGCDPLKASYWLMCDKIEVTAVISPCPHHGIPNEQNRIKELKFSRENIMVASVCISLHWKLRLGIICQDFWKSLSSYYNIFDSAPGSIILQMQKPHLCDKRQQVVVGLQLSDPCAGGQCWEFYLIN